MMLRTETDGLISIAMGVCEVRQRKKDSRTGVVREGQRKEDAGIAITVWRLAFVLSNVDACEAFGCVSQVLAAQG